MSSRVFRSLNPWTNKEFGLFKFATAQQINQTLDNLSGSPILPMQLRQERMIKFGELLEQNALQLATLITKEMGKPISQAKAEVLKSSTFCKFIASKAPSFLEGEQFLEGKLTIGVRYDPLGTILSIQPFNFPVWLPIKFAAGALMAGNKVLLKPAENVPQTSQTLNEMLMQSGWKGYFDNLFIEASKINQVIGDHRVHGVTVTGGKFAGQQVATTAGQHLKKCVLELGGSDPFIVLPDADPIQAAKLAAAARLAVSGQVCISAKRFLVHEDLKSKFIQGLIEEIETYKYEDPLKESTKIGPMARPDLLTTLDRQIKESIQKGAKLLKGGKKRDNLDANIYEITILDQVTPNHSVFQEETFGPVFPITTANSVEKLISLANNSKYGLGAVVCTANQNVDKVLEEIVPRIDSGLVGINNPVISHQLVPFGGIKESGFGRELGSHSLKEFCNAKSYFKKKE